MKKIALFVGLTAALSALIQLHIIQNTKSVHGLSVLLLMWVPGLVAMALSYHYNHKGKDLALIKPGKLSLTLAYVIPAGAALLVLLGIVALDIGQLTWPANPTRLIIAPVLSVALGSLFALGEELGWRGFLHTHMLRAQVRYPFLKIGIIWSVWHWPLILFANYATSPIPWLSVLLFTVAVTSFSIILGWLREFSKSVWPPVVAHAVHNVWMQELIPTVYLPGRLDPFFGGESGFLIAIIYLGAAMYISRKHLALPY